MVKLIIFIKLDDRYARQINENQPILELCPPFFQDSVLPPLRTRWRWSAWHWCSTVLSSSSLGPSPAQVANIPETL